MMLGADITTVGGIRGPIGNPIVIAEVCFALQSLLEYCDWMDTLVFI